MAVFKSLTFDSVNSLTYGIYITGQAVYNAPQRVVNLVTVPGRNGAIAIDEGRFENIQVTYPAGCFADDQSDFAEKISAFRNALASKRSYKRLTDEYHADEYRQALYMSGLEVTPTYGRAGQFDIIFECKPQRFLLSGETAVTLSADGSITNPTAFDSRPLLVVTGTGVLDIGGHSLTILSGGTTNQTLYIDCETQEAWELVAGAKVARNDCIQNAGETFPVLSQGENTILLGTGISTVSITPRWWKI